MSKWEEKRIGDVCEFLSRGIDYSGALRATCPDFHRNIQQGQSQPGSDPRLFPGRFLQGSLQDLSEAPYLLAFW